jgi:acyl-CoA synthetase (AMP-forming)/AMP-acid ligase II
VTSLVDRFFARSISVAGERCTSSTLDQVRDAALSAVDRLGPRARSVLLLDRTPLSFAARYFALLDAGHRPIPLAPDTPRYQLDRLRRTVGGSVEWAGDAMTAEDGEPGPLSSGSYGCITSGTTSTPRLCVLTVDGALHNARAHARSLGLADNHTLLHNLPLHHSFGLIAYLFTPLVTGCAIDFSPVFLTLRSLGRRSLEGAALHMSPAQLRFMLRERGEMPPGLAIASVGSGLAQPGELSAFRSRAVETRLYVTYGLTEAGPRVATAHIHDDASLRSGMIGRPIDGVTASVVDDRGEQRTTGSGSLCIDSPSLMQNLDSSMLAPDGRSLRTQDRVEILSSGELVFFGREDDLIKVGGVSVYAKDIEAIVRDHEAISDCIVMKRTDALYGEVFDLVVESRIPDLTLEVADKLSVVQQAQRTVIVPELPRTALGKIDRPRLRELLAEAP